MLRILALLRHGIASGQAPGSPLLPEGVTHLRRLGTYLVAEGWKPGAIVSSPYARARESAIILGETFGNETPLELLPELLPEAEPEVALAAILATAAGGRPVLVVSHLPLVGRIAHELLGDDPGFSPGTFVEIAREADGSGRLLRRVAPRDLPEAGGE